MSSSCTFAGMIKLLDEVWKERFDRHFEDALFSHLTYRSEAPPEGFPTLARPPEWTRLKLPPGAYVEIKHGRSAGKELADQPLYEMGFDMAVRGDGSTAVLCRHEAGPPARASVYDVVPLDYSGRPIGLSPNVRRVDPVGPRDRDEDAAARRLPAPAGPGGAPPFRDPLFGRR